MTSLWRNFSGTVFANSNWSYLFLFTKFIEECNRFNNMYGALSALHVSLNIASMRTVRRWLKKNSGHLITLQTWISLPWRYHVRGATHEDFWNLRPKPNTVSEWKSAQRDANTARWLWYIYIRRAKNFRTVVDSLTRGAERPKFNQLEMVTAFTYKPSLVKIDARNFELSW